MSPLEFAWCLTFLFLKSSSQSTDVSPSRFVKQVGAFYSKKAGSSITLPCFYGEGAVMLYWFKQTLGQKPNVVATFYKHDEHANLHNELRNDPRVALDVGNGKNHLQISDLQTSDSATYYCVAIDAYKFEFGEGVTINVEGSDSNIHTLAQETFQPGGFEALSCTVDLGSCDGEHSFYWFKEAKESHPGLIYTQGGRNDLCRRTMMTPTHTCDYSLPLKNPNVSDDEADRCAVASCGDLLFRDWKNVETAGEPISPDLIVILLSGALTFTIILSAWMVFSICRIKKTIQFHCAVNSDARPAHRGTADSEGYQDEESLQYSSLRQIRFNGSRRQRDDTRSQCVYASVKQARSTFEQHSVATMPDNTLDTVC